MSASNGAVDSEKDSKGRSHSLLEGASLRPAFEISFSINISFSADFCTWETRDAVLA